MPNNRGIGAAGVQLTDTAVKEHGDTEFTLHTTKGLLRLERPKAGSTPLSALVELDAFVLHGQDVLKHVSGSAALFGNGGVHPAADVQAALRGLVGRQVASASLARRLTWPVAGGRDRG